MASRRMQAGSKQPRPIISRCARSRSSAARTRSRRTSSPRPCWGCEGQMQFDLTDEQRLLGESLGRFIADRYGFEERLAAMREPEGFSRALWQELAALGVLGLPFAEEDG